MERPLLYSRNGFTLFLIFIHFSAIAQTTNDTTLAKLTALRDDYIGKIKSYGLNPMLQPPKIIMDNPPSFGMYDDSTNVLHTGNWTTMPANMQAFFTGAAKKYGETGEAYFENSVHKWIFVHELSHWWRACQHQTALHYENEKAANRLAIAYWRERDSTFLNYKLNTFNQYLIHIPSPVPAGQDKEKYFNDSYGSLPGATAYTWYQSAMIVDAAKETPALTFKETVVKAGNK